ncbi:hypothetical protein Q1695_007252 [Nippostrongylus brasiliensis]|nr:hypothetical protein Q1695_007252 [Nippostrongylus brasiliensis]
MIDFSVVQTFSNLLLFLRIVFQFYMIAIPAISHFQCCRRARLEAADDNVVRMEASNDSRESVSTSAELPLAIDSKPPGFSASSEEVVTAKPSKMAVGMRAPKRKKRAYFEVEGSHSLTHLVGSDADIMGEDRNDYLRKLIKRTARTQGDESGRAARLQKGDKGEDGSLKLDRTVTQTEARSPTSKRVAVTQVDTAEQTQNVKPKQPTPAKTATKKAKLDVTQECDAVKPKVTKRVKSAENPQMDRTQEVEGVKPKAKRSGEHMTMDRTQEVPEVTSKKGILGFLSGRKTNKKDSEETKPNKITKPANKKLFGKRASDEAVTAEEMVVRAPDLSSNNSSESAEKPKQHEGKQNKNENKLNIPPRQLPSKKKVPRKRATNPKNVSVYFAPR